MGSSRMNVARIEAAATTSGSSASIEPKTNASTISAPSAPMSVSPSTPGPELSSEFPAASTSEPVTPTVAPGRF